MGAFGTSMTVEDLYGLLQMRNIGARKSTAMLSVMLRTLPLLTEQGWRVLIIWECQLKKNVAEQNLKMLYDKIIEI